MTQVAYGQGESALLDAAIRVASRDGLRGLTYRAVAAEAGVTHGLVAYHFGSRAVLIRKTALRAVSDSVDAVPLESDAPGYERFAEGLAAFTARDEVTQVFLFELALEARRDASLLPVMEEAYEAYRARVRSELLNNGIDDPDLAHLVFAALDGLVFQQVTLGTVRETRGGVDRLRALLRAYSARFDSGPPAGPTPR